MLQDFARYNRAANPGSGDGRQAKTRNLMSGNGRNDDI